MAAINKFILSAIKKRDVERFLQLAMMPGFEVDYVHHKRITPLIYAVELGLGPAVETLINLGADLEWVDGHGKTAVFHACRKNRGDILQILIKAGCDVNKMNEHGDTPMCEAITKGHTEIVEELIKAGCEVNKPNRVTGHTLLQLAVLHVQPDIVDTLLQNSARPNKCTAEGETALHYAVQVSSVKIIQSLINAGADIDKFNNIGETPFMIAVQEGQLNSARELVYAGCKIDRYLYVSPLSTACLHNNQKMIKYLLSEGYNVSKDTPVRQQIFLKLEESNPELLDYVYHRCLNPLTLKELCRLRIRSRWRNTLEMILVSVVLPKQLKEFLIAEIIY